MLNFNQSLILIMTLVLLSLMISWSLIHLLWKKSQLSQQALVQLNQQLLSNQQELLNRLMTKTWSEYVQLGQSQRIQDQNLTQHQEYEILSRSDESDLRKTVGLDPDDYNVLVSMPI